MVVTVYDRINKAYSHMYRCEGTKGVANRHNGQSQCERYREAARGFEHHTLHLSVQA